MAPIAQVGFNDPQSAFAQSNERAILEKRPRPDSNQLVDREVVRRQADVTPSRLQERPATQPEREVELEGALARQNQLDQRREVNDRLSDEEIGLYKDPTRRR
ncbi:MAG: hypothetical protein AAGA18_15230 [Verrucomicrobiota bacterium]